MIFNYEVLDRDQQTFKGSVDATNRTNAITLLHSKGYTIVNLKEEHKIAILDIKLFQRVRTKDFVIFSKQISTLFEAEIPALKAFNLVSDNIQNEYFQGILKDIAKSIEKGSSIENAFGKHKDIFGEFFVAVVGVGEKSGTLPHSFTYLASYIERNAKTVRTIRKALTYPIFVIVMFFAVMILMFVSVIPKISSILLQSGAELPTITKVILGISEFMQDNIALLLIGITVTIISIFFYVQTEDGRRGYHSMLVSTPLIGKMFRQFYLVRMTSNLGVMLSSGVSIVQSLEILSRVLTNVIYKEMVDEIGKEVQQGTPLSSAFERQPIIGENVSQIIRIGEETGELTKMLEVISDFYDQQLKDTIDTLIDLIQPTVIVILGISVGVLIGSVILPIYSISASI